MQSKPYSFEYLHIRSPITKTLGNMVSVAMLKFLTCVIMISQIKDGRGVNSMLLHKKSAKFMLVETSEQNDINNKRYTNINQENGKKSWIDVYKDSSRNRKFKKGKTMIQYQIHA